jgi:PEP-CTERM motif
MGALTLHGDFLVAHPGPYTSEQVAAAIQIAMWDIEYGTAFAYDALGSPIDAEPPLPSGLVAQYISNVGTGNPWDEYFGFGVFTGRVNQPFNQTVIWAPELGITLQTLGIPEPSTWAMMIVGFAGLGFAGYRSVKAKAAFAKA